MTPENVLYPPWTDEQVANLNRWQVSGYTHPFTCSRCRDADLGAPMTDEHALVATPDGWVCPTCDYTQRWAHILMAEERVGRNPS